MYMPGRICLVILCCRRSLEWFFTWTKKHFPLPHSHPPKTHFPGLYCPRWYFRWKIAFINDGLSILVDTDVDISLGLDVCALFLPRYRERYSLELARNMIPFFARCALHHLLPCIIWQPANTIQWKRHCNRFALLDPLILTLSQKRCKSTVFGVVTFFFPLPIWVSILLEVLKHLHS